jgi:hypothetical protein
MLPLSFFQWCQGLAISQVYRQSVWLFAVTQALHLVAITAFMGAILIGDLRMLGWGPVGQSRVAIARSAHRVLLWAGLAVLVTGVLQFTTNALSYSRSAMFADKMWLLAATLIFTVTLRRWVALSEEGRLPSWAPKVVGATSAALWMSVVVSGRLITYF